MCGGGEEGPRFALFAFLVSARTEASGPGRVTA